MSINLPLEQMSLAEKLETMEALWANLSLQHCELPSPTWHGDILRERQSAVDAGELHFVDWDTMMTQLRNELGEDRSS